MSLLRRLLSLFGIGKPVNETRAMKHDAYHRRMDQPLTDAELDDILARAARIGFCSRCRQQIKGFSPPQAGAMTAGYYVASAWPDFTDRGDYYICDECMWADPRYILVYGDQAVTRPSKAGE